MKCYKTIKQTNCFLTSLRLKPSLFSWMLLSIIMQINTSMTNLWMLWTAGKVHFWVWCYSDIRQLSLEILNWLNSRQRIFSMISFFFMGRFSCLCKAWCLIWDPIWVTYQNLFLLTKKLPINKVICLHNLKQSYKRNQMRYVSVGSISI